MLIIAFPHVHDLEACAELPLLYRYEVLCDHHLTKQLLTWDEKKALGIHESSWVEAIALLMIGHKEKVETINNKVSLLSDRGWSIYLCTFGDADPSYVDPGAVAIVKGVPCRNGVRKHTVIDGPDHGHLGGFSWEVVENSGEQARLRCMKTIGYGRPYCGERRDTFLVSLRLTIDRENVQFSRRTGYAELFCALWAVEKTRACDHPSHNDSSITLPQRCMTVSGMGNEIAARLTQRVIICLTAHNTAARWRALIVMANTRYHSRRKLLRWRDCCFQCAIDQTASEKGDWFLVL